MPCPSQSSRFDHPGYIRWTVQTMTFLVVEPSSLPILTPHGPKYSPRDPVFIHTLNGLFIETSRGCNYEVSPHNNTKPCISLSQFLFDRSLVDRYSSLESCKSRIWMWSQIQWWCWEHCPHRWGKRLSCWEQAKQSAAESTSRPSVFVQ